MAKTAGNAKKIGRRGRKRRVAGWTLLLLGLLVAAVWVASGWWWYAWLGGSKWTARICEGSVQISTAGEGSTGYLYGWSSKLQIRLVCPPGGDWNCGIVSYTTQHPFNYADIEAMFWPIPLLLWTPAALLLRSGILARRRAMTGQCGKCGYSLAGLGGASDAPCPECGNEKPRA